MQAGKSPDSTGQTFTGYISKSPTTQGIQMVDLVRARLRPHALQAAAHSLVTTLHIG